MSKINYNLKLIKGFVFDVDGVLSPSTIPTDIHGEPLRMVNIKDGYALQLAVKHDYKIAIITGADSEGVSVRYGSLGIRDIYRKVAMKRPCLEKWLEENNLHPSEIAYVGDDIPDMECLMLAGLKVAPADAAVEVKQIANYITVASGGYGVARELIEEVMKAQNQWMNVEKAFGW